MAHEHRASTSDQVQWESLRIISVLPWIVWLACALALLSLIGWRVYAQTQTPMPTPLHQASMLCSSLVRQHSSYHQTPQPRLLLAPVALDFSAFTHPVYLG